MGSIPFTIYDALGYVAAGLIVLVAATVLVAGELPTEVSIVAGIAIGVAGYVVGHCISAVSTWALDRVLFNDDWGLGRPEKVLLGDQSQGSAPWLWRTLFGHYYSRLPEATQQRVKEKARAEGLSEDAVDNPAALLVHCESKVQSHQICGPRADRYEMLTTFLRNSSTAFLISAVLLVFAPADRYLSLPTARGGPAVLSARLLAALALLAAGLLFFRYVSMFLMWRRAVFLLYSERTDP
ncbi:MAG TPA: hypothetical protein VHJ78_02715 [Actinomycetota bacterium]|nr:hypothetical protein [Actinomycetota bacterium]